MGASNHSNGEREKNDFYATDPKALELLLEKEEFSEKVWEPACGKGHLSKVLEKSGYDVISTDLIYRGFGNKEPLNFLEYDGPSFDGDIISNPPYGEAQGFVEKALKTVGEGHKVAMFLKLSFLEGQKRRKLYEDNPPARIYVFSSRVKCGKNGDFDSVKSSAIAYAWYVWEKGYTGDPALKWVG